MKKDEIIAMAVAVIAEEVGTDIKGVRVISFNELDNEQEEKNEHLSD